MRLQIRISCVTTLFHSSNINNILREYVISISRRRNTRVHTVILNQLYLAIFMTRLYAL